MANRDSAELLFEPTGDIAKDYSAYCEIDDKPEREDFLDGIVRTELPQAETPAGTSRVRTQLILRNIEPPGLHKRDAQPLINSIPHCPTLQRVHLTNCGVTEHSFKLLAEAAYKSPTMTSFACDFNSGNGLLKDSSVSKKDKNEVAVNPNHYRGQHLKLFQEEQKDETAGKGKGKNDPKAKAAAAKAQQQQQEEADKQDKPPISIPTGFHAIFLSGIQQLSLRGNGITDSQVQSMVPLLENHSELLSLSLWGNNITSQGAIWIANALANNRRLTALNLGHNRIDDAGVSALAKIFYNVDVSSEEALKMRQKVNKEYASQDLPAYPTYNELMTVATAPPPDEATQKKDAKKKDTGGKKGTAPGPVDRHKTDFDKDCFKLEEGQIRIPGNWSLWALNLSHNAEVTTTGLKAFQDMLESAEPEFEKCVPGADGTFSTPPNYAPPSLALNSLDLTHPKLAPSTLSRINDALERRKNPPVKEQQATADSPTTAAGPAGK